MNSYSPEHRSWTTHFTPSAAALQLFISMSLDRKVSCSDQLSTELRLLCTFVFWRDLSYGGSIGLHLLYSIWLRDATFYNNYIIGTSIIPWWNFYHRNIVDSFLFVWLLYYWIYFGIRNVIGTLCCYLWNCYRGYDL